MKHLIVSREFPPAPAGGIGTYVYHISRLLAEEGETVHVIGQLWQGAEKAVEERCEGRLVIHRVPFEDWRALLRPRRNPMIRSKIARQLFASGLPAQCFSWEASLLAERLVQEEGIDIIEAQDYEAPLFFFQFRRALGLGPKRRPPCIVHLHSPTEFIARYNDWDVTLPAWQTAKRMENHCIRTADGLLCPSRFFARQAELHYGLSAGRIETIPYPLGDGAEVKRDFDTWLHGSICYVGRLERRKGILEWLRAAVAVAREYPSARFEFIGANVISANRILSEEFIDRVIPRAVKRQFTFHGEIKRTALPALLAQARIAVVPSRWDNFPNTCMEAMQSGLPVIATREGGMVEMITDGQTGWLAKEATVEGLRQALRRALGTPAEKLAKMGRQAAERIAAFCDVQQIVSRHLKVRTHFVRRRAQERLIAPVSLLREDAPSPEGEGNVGAAHCKRPANVSQSAADDALDVTELNSIETGWAGPPASTIQEPLATAQCLVRNPRLAMRIFQQVAVHLMRSRRGGV